MSNRVYIKGGKKVCRPINSRAEYMQICNSTHNIDNWKKYRETGEEKYKRDLEQFTYNCQTKDGEPLKSNETVSPFFFYDIDCGNKEECRRIMKELVERKDELGLVEVSQSASYGVHAVGRRVPGTTILENQVRLSIATQTEMDTNNKENNRVVFHGPIDPQTTPLLDDALFTERLTDEEAIEEYKRLKERERRGEEQVPAGAKKANKHYRPWKDSGNSVAVLQCCSSKSDAGRHCERSEAIQNSITQNTDSLDCFVPRNDAKREQLDCFVPRNDAKREQLDCFVPRNDAKREQLDCFVPRNDAKREQLDCFVPRNDAKREQLDCFVPRNDAKRERLDCDAGRHCERSEAIQSSSVGEGGTSNNSGSLDCFVPRNDGEGVNDGNGNYQLSTAKYQLSAPDSRTRFIAKGVMKEKKLTTGDFVNEGGRHTTVKIFLGGATQLLTKAEVNGILSELMPEHWADENIQQLVEDFYKNYTNPSQKLYKYQEELFTQSQRLFGEVSVASRHCERSEAIQGTSPERSDGLDCFVVPPRNDEDAVDDTDEEELQTANSQLQTKKLPQGVRESVEAVGPSLAMPVITAICPCIGALATGVQLDVHKQKRGLNLIAYIAGDFASGKGQIDPVVDAWMSEVKALDKMYLMQEDEWRAKKRAAKNKKEQPEEPKLPIRCLTLNNTVANLAERLANTEGKHAFSFTPEADTVAQKWRSSLSDFSLMLRQSYDGTNYEREARSADAVNVHIEKLLWNVTMCGTPDALYRVVSNYTDGFQSRIALARMPDNTFAPLEDNPYVLTDLQASRIQQIAHLLPLMQGEVVLPKLEAKGREWLERVRLEALKDDDKTKAQQRKRVCVITQRMTCCLMLCKVCETLIQKHGANGAEARLKQNPNLWKEMLLKTQTQQMLDLYDTIADALMENALYFFRERIENAFASKDYMGGVGKERIRYGKNDSIFERLDLQFTLDQAMQQSVAIKGACVTRNSVKQMLKNWCKQGLIVRVEAMKYKKM